MRLLTFLSCSFLLFSCSHSHSPALNEKQEVQKIHSILDNWHAAAATADEDTFFGTMTDSAIYLGTDKTERWLRDELKEWSAEYFERDKAWAFTASNREVYFSKDGRTAWFEELLDTWMGPCRGSGVLSYSNGDWKLEHYNLAVLIDNDDIQAVIDVTQQPNVPLDSLPDSQ